VLSRGRDAKASAFTAICRPPDRKGRQLHAIRLSERIGSANKLDRLPLTEVNSVHADSRVTDADRGRNWPPPPALGVPNCELGLEVTGIDALKVG